MVELLADWKRIIIEVDQRQPTVQDFRMAWDRSWEIMRMEHSWPHKTPDRRGWREAQDATRDECLAAFIGKPTAFSFAARRLSDAASSMCLRLEPEQLGKALLAAVAYVAVDDEEAACRASDAAATFITGPIDLEAAA